MTVDISFAVGHDSGACFFDHDTKQFKIIEIDKVLQRKFWRYDTSANYIKNERFFVEIIRDKAVEAGIDLSDVGTVLRGSIRQPDMVIPYFDNRPSQYWGNGSLDNLCRSLIEEVFNPKEVKFSIGHHRGHVSSTWHQSGFDKAYVLSVDGWGNDTAKGCAFWYIDPDRSGHIERILPDPAVFHSDSHIGGNYQRAGCSFTNKICKASDHDMDICGKIMGAAAFGSMSKKHQDIYKSSSNIHNNFFHTGEWEELIAFLKWYSKYKSYMMRLKERIRKVDLNWNNIFQLTRKTDMTEEEEFNNAWQIQNTFQTKFMKTVISLLPDIKEMNNNLIITGGTGLNVINNAALQDMLDINVFVAGNTNDVGLPFGHMMNHLRQEKVFNIRDKVDITYAGFEIWDKKDLSNHCSERPHRKVNIKDISKMLVEGETIGFINGGHEIGPRALGNRSILCNPSLPEMKDRINDIKKREKYRPFAPICRYEDATKHFDVDPKKMNPKKFQHMTIAARTRARSVDKMPAITHVDGSARLQTVTREQNSVVWDILTETSKFTKSGETLVLLNTSFNVRGKPTLNSFKEAFEVFDNSSLDHVVYWENGVGYDFYK